MNIGIKFDSSLTRINGNELGTLKAKEIIEKYGNSFEDESNIILTFDEAVVNVAPSFVTDFIGTLYEFNKSIIEKVVIHGSSKVEDRFAIEITYYKKMLNHDY